MKRVYVHKPDTLQKARSFPLSFYIQKSKHFTLSDFYEKFKLEFIYKKHNTFCSVLFYIQKDGHFTEMNTICVTFYIQASRHFVLRDFSQNFCNWWSGRHFYMQKISTLRDISICKKKITIRSVFISKIYRIVLTPKL